MLKSEVQHQFWITKKAVQRKLGSKEDEYIVSSDAGLDSKISLFKSISDTCAQLNKIIDQYQERLCILSQEECTFGRFLKEIGKRSKTTGTSITNSGKAIYYCGQQRMSVRLPLIRLQHEVDVFRCRAIEDTLITVNCMEKERTEYRAALCWMKSLSIQLDPDNNKGLDKFRRAQFHVRNAKESFDKLSMDCIQKIDLLSAARCNMFSHGLVAYMTALLQFSKKSSSTFKTVSSSLTLPPRYNFCILKDLSQNTTEGNIENPTVQVQDIDQSMLFSVASLSDSLAELKSEFRHGSKAYAELFTNACDSSTNAIEGNARETRNAFKRNVEVLFKFNNNPTRKEDFHDKENGPAEISCEKPVDDILIELSQTIKEIDNSTANLDNDLSSLWCENSDINKYFAAKVNLEPKEFILDTYRNNHKDQASELKHNSSSKSNEKKIIKNWFDLFADLDPLENLQSFDMKLNGKSDTQQT